MVKRNAAVETSPTPPTLGTDSRLETRCNGGSVGGKAGDLVDHVTDDLRDGLLRIDLAPQLVEIRDVEIRAELDAAAVRLELAEHDTQQRALADAVVADDAEPVAAHDAQGKVLQQNLICETVSDVAQLDDFAPGDLVRLIDVNPRGARAFGILTALKSLLKVMVVILYSKTGPIFRYRDQRKPTY